VAWGLTVQAQINLDFKDQAGVSAMVRGKFHFGMDRPPAGYVEVADDTPEKYKPEEGFNAPKDTSGKALPPPPPPSPPPSPPPDMETAGEKEMRTEGFALNRVEIDAQLNVSVGEVMQLEVSARFRWPCRSYMAFKGFLALDFGSDVMTPTSFTMAMTINCPTAEMFTAEGGQHVYTVRIKATLDEYNQRLENTFCKFAEDTNGGDDLYAVVFSKHFADEEVVKAKNHIKALREQSSKPPGLGGSGDQNSSSSISSNDVADFAGCEVIVTLESIKVIDDPPVRKAWEFIAFQGAPMEFAGGKFTIRNILLRMTAFDNPLNPTPPLDPTKDVFPSMDGKHHDLRGFFSPIAEVEVKELGDTPEAAMLGQMQLAQEAEAASKGMTLAELGAESEEAEFTFKSSAAVNLTFAKDAAAAEMTVGWNLTAMIFIEVKTDEFHMQLTANYSVPCDRTGAAVAGFIKLDVPGSITVDAIITGTLYCVGAAPGVEFYAAVNSMMIADVIELIDVEFIARGFAVGDETEDAGGQAGGSLPTSTRPTLNLFLLLPTARLYEHSP